MKIFLELTSAQSTKQKSRLRYAFQLFCAVYGHRPILHDTNAGTADLRITYAGNSAMRPGTKVLRLHNGYRARPLSTPAPQPRSFGDNGIVTVLFYPPENSAEVDWLAEIFEWTSCADEYSITARDSVGRIPFANSVFARYELDERKPYAALAMWFLQRAICKVLPNLDEKAQAPVAGLTHAIVCSHDVDFLPLGYLSTLGRLAKNSLICLPRSPFLALGIAARTLRFAVAGPNPLQQVEWLAEFERASGVTSSFLFIVRHCHRRDANYRIESSPVIELLKLLQSRGMEIGVHGSYTSLDTSTGLADEFELFQKYGFHSHGNRQHWLRFSLDRLIPAVERAGALFDTSVGWHDRIGFRAGACFAFPPYNFEKERPATFIEIPLAVMDQALPSEADKAFSDVANLLAISRTYGWGGISLLWHPTAFGGGQLPVGVGRAFYELVDARSERNETWLCAGDFLRTIRKGYVDAGLMDPTWGTDLTSDNDLA